MRSAGACGFLLLILLVMVVPYAGASAVPGELIIGFRPGGTAGLKQAVAGIDAVSAEMGATVTEEPGTEALPDIRLVHLPENASVESAAEAFSAEPGVLFAEPNYIAHLDGVTPDDPLYTNQWGLVSIRAPGAWEKTTGSRTTVVAVLDTGMDITHPDLADNTWRNPKEVPGNGKDDDGNGYIDDIQGWDFVGGTADPTDENGHGTLCAGILGATGNNAIGTAGVAWKVSLLPVKVFSSEGTADTATLLRGISYAEKAGASVISCSWSMEEESKALKQAISGSSALFVFSAGNGGDTTPRYPAASDLGNIISVTASDSSDAIPSFASRGVGWVDLAAPGVSLEAPLAGGSYGLLSGSSAAVPLVSGTAALMKGADPSLSASAMREAILGTVDHAATLTGLVQTGGRLNASGAVSAVITPPVPAPRALFAVNRTSGYAPLTVSFTDRSRNSPASWLWDFGDGTRSSEQSPVHVYPTGGRYRTTLTVTNKGGSSTIQHAAIPVLLPRPPRAIFKLNVSQDGLPVRIRCIDLSSGYPDRWLWNFGDGVISMLQEPVHVYTAPGVYYVRLTVWNAWGNSTVVRRLPVR